jgi:hypothetical protein
MGWCELDSSDSGLGQVESSCEFGNEPSGSIKWRGTIEVAAQLVTSQVELSSIELVSYIHA